MTSRNSLAKARHGSVSDPGAGLPANSFGPRVLVLGLCLALGATALSACGGDKVVVKNLYLRVSSDAPRAGGRLERLRILFNKDGKHFPARLDQPEFNPVLASLDPIAKPVLLSVAYDGATFGDGVAVSLEVTGLMTGRPVTRFAGTVDLAADLIVDVHLAAVGDNCDVDGDGFLDCSGAGCCAGGSEFSDCEPASAGANPWGSEAACEPCSDTVDNDCQGGDVACVDSDSDTVPDCEEAACGSENDPAVAPGLAETCDDRDNDCDGGTDEGLTINYLGQSLAKGATCGTGLCAGGQIACDGAGGLRCSTDSKKLAAENCATAEDDDCNGLTNEGCELTDVDGDGYVGDKDCDDHDSGVFKGGQAEACCPAVAKGDTALEAACDKNCDGERVFCAADDKDGDGFTEVAGDCDDTNPLRYPGAPERCEDGVDQDCFGGDLMCTGLVDADSDGWAQELDCDDHDAARRPDAVETCDGVDDNCNNLIDDGNPTAKPAGEACGDTDGECATQRGVWVCRNSGGTFVGVVDCVGDIEPVGATEGACDAKDDDCDGETDEDFLFDGGIVGALCDGTGECGQGEVECSKVDATRATCSTNPDGSTSGAEPEICDQLDNNCDGTKNEGLTSVADSTCQKTGVCGANLTAIHASCTPEGTWACDYRDVPSYKAGVETSCDGKDNDCNGETDSEFATGTGCDGDADPDQCADGKWVCATDGISATCDDGATTVAGVEICDGQDNDCDGQADEDFKPGGVIAYAGGPNSGDAGKGLGATCGTGLCTGGQVVCDQADPARLTLTCDSLDEVATDHCNGADDDCDGTTDEDYLSGAAHAFDGGGYSGDVGKHKGDTCGTGACAGGTVVCDSLTTLKCSNKGNASDEICNNVDDDCNGTTDGRFKAGGVVKYNGGANGSGKVLGDACGTGECAGGHVICDTGDRTKLTCDSLGDIASDSCNSKDDNCDGVTDEDFLEAGAKRLSAPLFSGDANKYKGQSCGTGVCATGTVVCTASGAALVCSTNGLAQASETCDSLDNTCNGQTDEGQPDADGDGLSDACDPCTDADGDGWRKAGTPGVGCAQTTTNDCDDAASNTSDPDHDNLCGTNDNCPTASNPAQTNSDSTRDATGDACDTCTDADNDGWRLAGTPGAGCSQTTTDDCDDTLANTNDPDGDNVCGAGDNCPNHANATQQNSDSTRDATGDACDTCTDADADGWRLAGTSGTACANAETNDCDDALNNTNDPEHDNVCNPLDNCPNAVNPSQTNSDANQPGDTTGDACDTCTDADNDGYRMADSLGVLCAQATTNDCDDSANNTQDPDADNLCGAFDNCPNANNPTQTNSDSTRDATGDACDTCTDADNDGYRLTGTPGTGCVGGTANDCDDTLANTADTDGDNVCVGDNCPDDANTSQTNSDADTLGDACDNCDLVANQAQDDADNDDVGDVCDTCTDMDGDGWGAGGNNAGCVGGKAGVLDCNDTAANTADLDRDNVCEPGDTCVDADGDGWGRAGFTRTGCAKPTVDDCDDGTETNGTNDPDADNVCNNGGVTACATGVTTGCADNCPIAANNTTGNVQLDTDRDGKGDSCDAACVYGPTPFEVCGDCIDNDCDGSTDETVTAQGCVMRRLIGIQTDVEPAPAEYSLVFQFDHAALVAAGRSTAGGDDIRIFYKDPALACDDASYSACYREIDRVLEPTRAWNAVDTAIWFATEATIPDLMLNTDYEVYFGVTSGTPQATLANVFAFADFFDRVDSATSIGNGWSVVDKDEGGGNASADVQIKSFQLDFVAANVAYAPYLSHTLPTLSAGTTGAWDVRIGFSWHRVSESEWRVFMQLGLASAMTPLDGTFVGLGPSLVWGGGAAFQVGGGNAPNNTLGTGAGTTFTSRGTINPTVVADIGLHLDFESGPNPNYDLFFGATAVSNIAFSVANQTSVDTIRFGADVVGASIDRHAFDYVIVQRSVVEGAPPAAGLGVEEPMGASCALGVTGDLVVKYKLADGTEGTPNPTTVTDSTANPITLTRTADGANGPDFGTFGAFEGLYWAGSGVLQDGEASSAALGSSSNDLATLDNLTRATIEIVVDSDDVRTVNAGGAYFLDILREDDTHRLSFAQLSGTASGNLRVAFNGSFTWTWTANTVAAGRTVYHVVVDTTLATSADRIRLYRDGALLTPVSSTAMSQNAVLDTITAVGSENTARIILGNDDVGNGSASMAGVLYYAAIYDNALTAAEVLANALILMRDDDR